MQVKNPSTTATVAGPVRATFEVPEGTTFVNASSECKQSAGVVTCEFLYSFTPTYSRQVDITVRAERAGTVTATASVTGGASATDTTVVTDDKPWLSLTSSADKGVVRAGETYSYYLMVKNEFFQTAAGPIKVAFAVPEGTTFVNASYECKQSAGVVTCEYPYGFTPSFARQVYMTVRAERAGTVTLPAGEATSAYGTPARSAPQETTVTDDKPWLSARITDGKDSVALGQDVNYTVTVKNEFFQSSGNIVATVPVPEGTSFVRANAPCVHSSGVVTCDPKYGLGPGQATSFYVTVRPTGPGVVTGKAQATTAYGPAATGIDETDQEPPDPDDHGQCEDPNACGSDPINFVTGNVYEYREDLSVPGTGMSLRFVRFYNSQDNVRGPLGYGWTHSYNASLKENADGSVTEFDPQGKRLKFVKKADGSYASPKGVEDALAKNADGTWRLAKKDGVEWLFDAKGKLEKLSDPDGSTLSLAYDPDGRPAKIANSAGREVTLSYDAVGRVSTLTDPAGGITRYEYDNGNLVSVTDPAGGIVRYEYDARRNLSKTADKTGGTFGFAYDGKDRVVSASAGDGTWKTTLAYDEVGKKTTVTDSKGARSVFHYNDMSRITRLVQPDATELAYTFDPNGNRTSRTDGAASTSRAAYDARGNPVEVVAPDGAVTKMTYDEKSNLTGVTDALGNTTRYSYDANGNLTSEIDALGNKTTYEYDAMGRATSKTDALGNVTRYDLDPLGRVVKATNPDGTTTLTKYDAAGNPVERTDGAGRITRSLYDPRGNILSTTDPLGNTTRYSYDTEGNLASETDALGRKTTHEYDALQRLVKVNTPDGTKDATGVPGVATTSYAYDAAGNRASVTDPLGNVTRMRYDASGRLVSQTDPLGNETKQAHDSLGRLVTQTDAAGVMTVYEYDALGRKTKETKPDGMPASPLSPPGAGTVSTSYAYDDAGNQTGTTDPLGRTTKLNYDPLGRLAKVTDPEGGTVSYGYDALGRKTKATNPNGHSTSYSYDSMGRLTKETDPLLSATSFAYDDAGNVSGRTDAKGRETAYAYDAVGRLTSTIRPDATRVEATYDAVGNVLSLSDKYGTISYAYDERDLPVSETLPGGRVLKHEYDKAGNRTALVHPDGTKTAYSYDAARRTTAVTDPAGARTAYAYNAVGQPNTVSLPNGAQESYAYDPLGRTISATATGPGGAVLSRLDYSYDKANNPVGITDETGVTARFAYDRLNRLVEESYPNRGFSYAYDDAGNRTSMGKTTPNGTTETSYSYDDAERMIQAGNATFEYDANGNQTAKVVGKSRTSYAYDYEDRLVEAGGTTYERDALGRAVSATVAGGNKTDYLFDGTQVVEERTGSAEVRYTRGAGQSLVSRKATGDITSYYHRDAIGSVVALSDEAGKLTDSYAYTAFGPLRDRTGESTQPFAYLSNAYDTGTDLYDFHARVYDPAAGRFLSKDPVKGLRSLTQTINPYPCSVNNPLAYPDPSGQFPQLLEDLIEDTLDQIPGTNFPSEGDSFHNGRADKTADDCPGNGDRRPRYLTYDFSGGAFGGIGSAGASVDREGTVWPFMGGGVGVATPLPAPITATVTETFGTPVPGAYFGATASGVLVYSGTIPVKNYSLVTPKLSDISHGLGLGWTPELSLIVQRVFDPYKEKAACRWRPGYWPL